MVSDRTETPLFDSLFESKFIFVEMKVTELERRPDISTWQKPYTNRNHESWELGHDVMKMQQKFWLRTDFGRSVVVAKVIQLVWLSFITGAQPSHFQQQPCKQKDTNLKICK